MEDPNGDASDPKCRKRDRVQGTGSDTPAKSCPTAAGTGGRQRQGQDPQGRPPRAERARGSRSPKVSVGPDGVSWVGQRRQPGW